MTDYKPGTVAIATVGGVADVRVFRCSATPTGESSFWVANHPSRLVVPKDSSVTDVRPLVVLDLTESELASCSEHLRHPMLTAHSGLTAHLLYKIQEQIAYQAYPQRIAEPGVWGVVSATCPDSDGNRWNFVRDSGSMVVAWTAVGVGSQWSWSQLTDPELVREGLS